MTAFLYESCLQKFGMADLVEQVCVLLVDFVNRLLTTLKTTMLQIETMQAVWDIFRAVQEYRGLSVEVTICCATNGVLIFYV